MKKRMFATVAAFLISTTMLLVLLCLLGRVSSGVSSPALAAPLQVTPMVALVDPASAPNDLDTPIAITGTDFVSTPTVYLGDTSLDDVNWVSTTTLEATVPWGMDPGVYTLTVENPGGESGSLSDAFTVTEGIGVGNTGEFYGGRVEQLVINPLTPTTLYAVSEHAGLFRSRDGGSDWSLKIAGPSYIVRRLAIDPLSPNRLYLFESGRSDDEGDTWTPLNMPGESQALRAYPHPLISGTVYASNHIQCGFWKSTDSGETWITITETAGLTDTCVTEVVFHPTDSQTMVAGSEELFRSTDGGETWSYASWHHPSAMAFSPFGAHELWLSHDGTYKSTNAEYSEWVPLGEPVGSRGLRNIKFAPFAWGGIYSGTVFVADSEGNAYKSTDGGDTWESFGPQAQVLDIVLHPTDPNIIYASSSCGGVYKTLDGGATWQQVNQGLTAMVPYELATIPGQPDLVYAIVEGCEGVFEGTRGGSTWQFLEVEGASIEKESSMLVDPYTPTRLYRSGYGTIYRSDDSGQTWPLSGTLPPPDVCSGNARILPTVLRTDVDQPGILLAGAGIGCNTPSGWTEIGGIYRSTDGGMTWATTLTPSQVISPVNALAYDHLTPTIVYAGTSWSGQHGSGILRSMDGGQSWQPVGRDVPAFWDFGVNSMATEPGPPYRVFVGISSKSTDEHCLYFSADHGESWQKPAAPFNGGVTPLIFAPGNPPALYAGIIGTDGLFRSTDGANSWTRAAGVLGQVPIYSLAVVTATDRVILYAGTTGGYVESGGAQALSAADNGGALVSAGVYRYTTRRTYTELHVCPSGCAYASVQDAVDVASDGDVIKVAAGTYNDIHVRNDITQVVYIAESVIIQGGYTTTNWTTPDPEANLTTLDAQGQGRVLYIDEYAGQAVIEGLRITGGDAAGLGGVPWGWDAGGGIYVRSAAPTISNNWIYSNTAGEGSTQGGGVYLQNSASAISSNTIFSNTAGWGGGIHVNFSPATVSHNTILSNTASEDGGGVCLWGDVNVTGNMISGNAAHKVGGGILAGGSTLINNVVTDNSANVSGSGLYIDRSAQLWHTTVARNTGGDGSGIFVTAAAEPSSVAFTNTILTQHSVGISVTAGNTITVNGILWYATPITVSQSLTATVEIQSQYMGDPAFAPDGYHLMAASTAIDKGVDAGITVDIDGDPRPASAGYDLGADEFWWRKVYLPLVMRNYQP